MIKAVFFDLDGTLLPMDEQKFIKVYFKLLFDKVKHLGYEEESFYNNIFYGVKLMMKNDGTKTNEQIFWDFFESVYGNKIYDDKPIFDDFYINEFKKAKACCEENDDALKIVKFVHEKNLVCVLSTNPLFPFTGTQTRMGFVNLKPDDFDLVTTYETSYYSKPNPMYFKTLLSKFNLKPEEVILFGNNVREDYECAKQAGIRCILVGEYIIGEYTNIEHIQMGEVIPFLNKEIKGQFEKC